MAVLTIAVLTVAVLIVAGLMMLVTGSRISGAEKSILDAQGNTMRCVADRSFPEA